MSWTLNSGRTLYGFMSSEAMPLPESQIADGAGHAVHLDARQHEEEDGCPATLTPSERREIADAVIACWNRWAETGEP